MQQQYLETMTDEQRNVWIKQTSQNIENALKLDEENFHSEQNHSSKVPGFVYVLESSDGTSVKIGRSQTPFMRLETIRKASNSTGNQWVSKLQDNSTWLEGMCHKHFSNNRMNGEWFSVKLQEVVDYVECTERQLKDVNCIANAKREKDTRMTLLGNTIFNKLS